MLTIEDDSQRSYQHAKTMMVDSLLKDSEIFNKVLHLDETTHPDIESMNRFFDTQNCVICNQMLDFSVGMHFLGS